MLVALRDTMASAAVAPAAVQPAPSAEPVAPVAQPISEGLKTLEKMGIAYSIVTTPGAQNDEVLDRVMGSEYVAHFGLTKPMSLRQLQNQMGIAFRIVSPNEIGQASTHRTSETGLANGPQFL